MCEFSGGKPVGAMKVKAASGSCGASFGAASTDHDSLMKGLSMSIYVGTRKMVIYA